MNLTPEVLAALIAAIAAVSSVIVSLIAVRRSKKNKISSIYTDISERYDNLIRFRTQHPQVLPLSRKWETRFLKSMYYPVTDEDKQWVIYFTYVELCIGYCSSVLMARANKLLDGDSYENQYLPLVRLLLTEHAPIIGGLVNEKKYVSQYIREFWKTQRESGWNWEEEYEAITRFEPRPGSPQPPRQEKKSDKDAVAPMPSTS